MMYEATKEEVRIYKMVENKIDALTETEFENMIEDVSDFVWNSGQARKNGYNKCRKWAKKLNCSILELETWYCIDEA